MAVAQLFSEPALARDAANKALIGFGDVPLHPTCADRSICGGVSGCQLRTTFKKPRR
jgi:hypothetical protein